MIRHHAYGRGTHTVQDRIMMCPRNFCGGLRGVLSTSRLFTPRIQFSYATHAVVVKVCVVDKVSRDQSKNAPGSYYVIDHEIFGKSWSERWKRWVNIIRDNPPDCVPFVITHNTHAHKNSNFNWKCTHENVRSQTHRSGEFFCSSHLVFRYFRFAITDAFSWRTANTNYNSPYFRSDGGHDETLDEWHS